MKKTTGQRIRDIRDTLGETLNKKISQEKLGKYAGVSKAAVSQWEREITLPERDPLLLLQRKLNINPDWIINGFGEMFLKTAEESYKNQDYSVAESTGLYGLNKDENNIIYLYRQLSEEQRGFTLSSITMYINQNNKILEKKQANT